MLAETATHIPEQHGALVVLQDAPAPDA